VRVSFENAWASVNTPGLMPSETMKTTPRTLSLPVAARYRLSVRPQAADPSTPRPASLIRLRRLVVGASGFRFISA